MAGFGLRSRCRWRGGFRTGRFLLLTACSSVLGTTAGCVWPGLVSSIRAHGCSRLAGLAPTERRAERSSHIPVCITTGRQCTLVVDVFRLAPRRRGFHQRACLASADCCNDHCVLACTTTRWNAAAALLCVGQFCECAHMVRLAEQSRGPGITLARRDLKKFTSTRFSSISIWSSPE